MHPGYVLSVVVRGLLIVLLIVLGWASACSQEHRKTRFATIPHGAYVYVDRVIEGRTPTEVEDSGTVTLYLPGYIPLVVTPDEADATPSFELSRFEVPVTREAVTDARRAAWALARKAIAAAQSNDCAEAKSLQANVLQTDKAVHDTVFVREISIMRCLAQDTPGVP